MLFYFNKVFKSYGIQHIFRELNFSVERGTFSILTGPSGVGKTTLFRMLCGVEKPTRGEIIFLGKRLEEHSATHLKNIGFIFQNPRGLPEDKVIDNVAIPLKIDGVPKDEREARAMEWLSVLGLRQKASSLFGSLSGGEVQKVEFARALIRKPRLILADEPTAHLDQVQGDLLLDILWDHYKEGATVFISTHHPPKFAHEGILRFHIENHQIRQLSREEISLPYVSKNKLSDKKGAGYELF